LPLKIPQKQFLAVQALQEIGKNVTVLLLFSVFLGSYQPYLGIVAVGVLKNAGIDINDPVNGVFLPAYANSPNPYGATVHGNLHTDKYYAAVTARLLANPVGASKVLDDIRRELLNNTFPH
jgi:hypothetical protein